MTLHRLVEAEDKDALARGMKSFVVRRIDSSTPRSGEDGAASAATATTVAISPARGSAQRSRLLLQNYKKHQGGRDERLAAHRSVLVRAVLHGVDHVRMHDDGERPQEEARTVLLRRAWRKHGLIHRVRDHERRADDEPPATALDGPRRTRSGPAGEVSANGKRGLAVAAHATPTAVTAVGAGPSTLLSAGQVAGAPSGSMSSHCDDIAASTASPVAAVCPHAEQSAPITRNFASAASKDESSSRKSSFKIPFFHRDERSALFVEDAVVAGGERIELAAEVPGQARSFVHGNSEPE